MILPWSATAIARDHHDPQAQPPIWKDYRQKGVGAIPQIA